MYQSLHVFYIYFLGCNPHKRYLTMVKTMMCWCYFIVQKLYDLLRAACGLLDFCPLTYFQTTQTSDPYGPPNMGTPFILSKVGLIWGIEWYLFIFICINLYKFYKCTNYTDVRTTDLFIAIPAVLWRAPSWVGDKLL